MILELCIAILWCVVALEYVYVCVCGVLVYVQIFLPNVEISYLIHPMTHPKGGWEVGTALFLHQPFVLGVKPGVTFLFLRCREGTYLLRTVGELVTDLCCGCS